jgi:hypothetical protein
MEGRKSVLLQRIESDREVLLDFLRCFIRCQSPNPPGDTREAADPPAPNCVCSCHGIGARPQLPP